MTPINLWSLVSVFVKWNQTWLSALTSLLGLNFAVGLKKNVLPRSQYSDGAAEVGIAESNVPARRTIARIPANLFIFLPPRNFV